MLAGKVPIEGALAHAGGLGHVVHLHLMVIAAGEDGLGRAQDALPETGGGRAAAAGTPRFGLRDGHRHLVYGPVRSHSSFQTYDPPLRLTRRAEWSSPS